MGNERKCVFLMFLVYTSEKKKKREERGKWRRECRTKLRYFSLYLSGTELRGGCGSVSIVTRIFLARLRTASYDIVVCLNICYVVVSRFQARLLRCVWNKHGTRLEALRPPHIGERVTSRTLLGIVRVIVASSKKYRRRGRIIDLNVISSAALRDFFLGLSLSYIDILTGTKLWCRTVCVARVLCSGAPLGDVRSRHSTGRMCGVTFSVLVTTGPGTDALSPLHSVYYNVRFPGTSVASTTVDCGRKIVAREKSKTGAATA